MIGAETAQSASETIAHVIQVALAPIFLLNGVAALLSVFSIRMSYVTQGLDALSREIAADKPSNPEHWDSQRRNLQSRSVLLDVAVIFGILGGTSTCAAAMLLFVSELDDSTGGSILFGMFGAALVFTILALMSLAAEMILTGRDIRSRLAQAVQGTGR